MAFVKIDGIEIEVESGINVIEAARQAGIEIPHYCYHPGLTRPANCRMCVVDIGQRQLGTACTTTIRETPPDRKIDEKYDLVVETQNERVKRAREYILEFLLVHHPLDCPVCDQAGECDLQNFSFRYGSGKSRYDEVKNVPPKKDLGADVLLYSTRCVVCTRCIRFCEEVAGTGELGLIQRGSTNEIDIMRDHDGTPLVPLHSKLSGNVVDICPVGALVSKDFLFKSRPWFLKKVNSVCAGCSKGCAITIEFKADGVYRLKPRHHPEVNGYWMCDDGRLGYHYVNSEDRLQIPLALEGEELKPTSWAGALRTIQARFAEAIDPSQICVVGSAYGTNEELYLVKKLAETLGTTRIGLYDRPEGERLEYPGFVIEADKNPNTRGALAILGEDITRREALWRLLQDAEVAFLMVGTPSDELSDVAKEALESVGFLVVLDVLNSEPAQHADMVLPGLTFAEKEGTYTNSTGWVQKLGPTYDPHGEARPDWLILRELIRRLGGSCDLDSPAEVMAALVGEVDVFADVAYDELGEFGLHIDPGSRVAEGHSDGE